MIFQLVSQTTYKQVHHTVDSFDLFPHVTGRLPLKGASNVKEKIVSLELFQPHMGQFTLWTSTKTIIGAQSKVHVLGSKRLF